MPVERVNTKQRARKISERPAPAMESDSQGRPQPNFIPEVPPAPEDFQYRLLTEVDREEALLIKVKALEQEHFALSNNFTLMGVAGPPLPDEGPDTDGQVQLARFRARRKQEIEMELSAIHPRVDEVRARAKANGRTLLAEARAADAEVHQRMSAAASERKIAPSGRSLTNDPFQADRRAAAPGAEGRQIEARPGIVRDGAGNEIARDPRANGTNSNPISPSGGE